MCLAATIDVKEQNGQGCTRLLFNTDWAPLVYEVLGICMELWEGGWGRRAEFNLLPDVQQWGCGCVCAHVCPTSDMWWGGAEAVYEGYVGMDKVGLWVIFFSSIQIFLKVVMLL